MHPSNRAAVQRSIQVRQQHHQIVQQNMRRQMMNRQLLLRQVVQEAVETRPSHEDVQHLAAIVEEAEKIGVEPEQLEANIRESTPFGWLLALLPQDRGERIAYLAIFVEVLLFLVGRVLPPEPRPEPQTSMTPEQVQQIMDQVERLVDEVVETAPTEAPSNQIPEE